MRVGKGQDMNYNATPTGEREWAGPSLFALGAGLVCIVAGWELAFRIEDVAGQRESFSAFRADTDVASNLLFALSLVIILTAWPVGRGQRGLFALTVFLQSLAYYAAITIAGFAQAVIAPERVYFVPLVVFMLLAWPVLVAGCLILERAGVAHANYRGLRRWTALAIPGMAACGLFADLVDAAGALPVLIEKSKTILLLAMTTPVWILANKAQPTRPTHWALFGILLAVLQISTVFVAMGVAWLVDQFGGNGSLFSLFRSVVVVVPMILLPLAVIRLAKAVTGPGGPWRPESSGKEGEAPA